MSIVTKQFQSRKNSCVISHVANTDLLRTGHITTLFYGQIANDLPKLPKITYVRLGAITMSIRAKGLPSDALTYNTCAEMQRNMFRTILIVFLIYHKYSSYLIRGRIHSSVKCLQSARLYSLENRYNKLSTEMLLSLFHATATTQRILLYRLGVHLRIFSYLSVKDLVFYLLRVDEHCTNFISKQKISSPFSWFYAPNGRRLSRRIPLTILSFPHSKTLSESKRSTLNSLLVSIRRNFPSLLLIPYYAHGALVLEYVLIAPSLTNPYLNTLHALKNIMYREITKILKDN